jgi:hypothetical protein
MDLRTVSPISTADLEMFLSSSDITATELRHLALRFARNTRTLLSRGAARVEDERPLMRSLPTHTMHNMFPGRMVHGMPYLIMVDTECTVHLVSIWTGRSVAECSSGRNFSLQAQGGTASIVCNFLGNRSVYDITCQRPKHT